MNNLIELFECLDAVIHDYYTTYDPVEDRESVVATVSTQKMTELHQAYNRCKSQAHEMNHYFMPMDSAPRDGTMVLLMGCKNQVVSGNFENSSFGTGWCTDRHSYCPDRRFFGWFPMPKIRDF
jgi:hypothetical protein